MVLLLGIARASSRRRPVKPWYIFDETDRFFEPPVSRSIDRFLESGGINPLIDVSFLSNNLFHRWNPETDIQMESLRFIMKEFLYFVLFCYRYSCCYNSFELDQAESRRIEKCYISYIPVADRWKESLVIRENESEWRLILKCMIHVET